MFQDLELTFNSGTILTAAMLSEVYDAPRDILSIQYSDYSEGVLAGAEIWVRDDSIWLGRGLMKLGSRIYRLADDVNLTAAVNGLHPSPQEFFRLVFVPEGTPELIDGRPSQKTHRLNLELYRGGQADDVNGIELACCKLFRGQLKINEELDQQNPAEPEYWNMIGCPYAGRCVATFHPFVFSAIRDSLLAAVSGSCWEPAVTGYLASTGVIPMQVLLQLLSSFGKEVASPADAAVSGPEWIACRREVLRALAGLRPQGNSAQQSSRRSSAQLEGKTETTSSSGGLL